MPVRAMSMRSADCSRCPVPAEAAAKVLFPRYNLQMERIEAATMRATIPALTLFRIVAGVVQFHAFRNGANEVAVRNPVRPVRPVAFTAQADLSISGGQIARPLPAAGHRVDVNVPEQSLDDWNLLSCRHSHIVVQWIPCRKRNMAP